MPFSRAMSRRVAGLLGLLGAGLLVALGPTSGCARAADCKRNSDCIRAYCDDGTCRVDCVDPKLDCPRGYTCGPTAQCEPPTDASTSDAGGDAHEAGGAGGADAATDASGGDGAPIDAATGRPALTPCASDGDCAASLVCRPLAKGGASRCTRACALDADCTSGTRCLTVGAETYCAASDVGRACSPASAAASCNAYCTQQGYCTVGCQSGADCPNGYGCMGVGTPSTRVCVRAEATCSTAGSPGTAACLGAAFCDESASMIVGGCTTGCASASDCPRRAAGLSPWTCGADGLCRRPADVFGPLPQGWAPTEWFCAPPSFTQVVDLCSDAQHLDFVHGNIPPPPSPIDCSPSNPMTTSGASTDACVDSCRYQGGCAWGYACSAIGALGASGQRIGLCLPTGGAEIGLACARDGDCVFGLCYQGRCSRDCTADGACTAGSTCTAVASPTATDYVEGQLYSRCL